MERTAEIGASVVIKGDVTAHEDIVISGRVEGTVSVENFSVTVRPGANLEADIDARAVIVGGHVTGTLSAAECIELQRTAQVEGESIVAAVLRLDDGAVFNGKAQTPRPRRLPSCSWRRSPTIQGTRRSGDGLALNRATSYLLRDHVANHRVPHRCVRLASGGPDRRWPSTPRRRY